MAAVMKQAGQLKGPGGPLPFRAGKGFVTRRVVAFKVADKRGDQHPANIKGSDGMGKPVVAGAGVQAFHASLLYAPEPLENLRVHEAVNISFRYGDITVDAVPDDFVPGYCFH